MAFYAYFLRLGMGGIRPWMDIARRMRPWMDIARCCGWWIPCRGACILQDRHSELHRDERGRLHRDGGMAVRYPDGWGDYYLHGVRMSAADVETPAERMDPGAALQRPNVEQRRELVRKIGIERMLAVLPHEVLDTRGDYALLRVQLPGGRGGGGRGVYLKMLNPSIGVWHMEGVSNACRTVQHALNWRAGNMDEDWTPDELT
jgi:hypothetical protein